jgi:adenosylhomocysteine nucleosidase
MSIVFALGIEAAGLTDRMKNKRQTKAAGFTVWQGDLDGRPIIVAVSGVGRAKAARATQAIIDAHRPAIVVSAGFAGGLDPAINRFGLVIPSSIACEDAEAIETSLPAIKLPEGKAHTGGIVTVDRIVHSSVEKLALGTKFSALAVDMESHSVATVCQRAKVAFMGLRVVSDPVDEKLPADMRKLIAQQTFAGQAGAVLGSIFRRPSAVKDMFRLHQVALEASDRLADFLERWTK